MEQSAAGTHVSVYATKTERKRIRSADRRAFPPLGFVHFRPNFKANRVIFYRSREREGGRERDRCSLGETFTAVFRLLFAAHDPSSPLPSTERRKEGKLHERNLPRYRKPFRCRADASNLCRVNDRLVKIEKSLAGCLSRASSRFLADPSSCPFTAIFRFRP